MLPTFTLLFTVFLHLTLRSHSINQDGLHLLRLTESLYDTKRFFSGWNARDATPCNWTGVRCSGPEPFFVTSLDFTNSGIGGPFPIILCRLPRLTTIIFPNNNINSSLPSDISTCSNLRHLDLTHNKLTGEIPRSLAEIPNLTYLDLSYNQLSGHVPDKFGKFHGLEVISLTNNQLNGKFPNFFSNVSTLKQLNLSFNPFQPSQLNDRLGNMSQLEVLWAQSCNLVGQIPNKLSGMESLIALDISDNGLTGEIPSSLTELTSLVSVELYNNLLSGELPQFGWGRMTSLSYLDVSLNKLTGKIPDDWGRMTSLRYLDASMNNLTGTIPDELTRLPLESLNLYSNNLEGVIPESVAESPNLQELVLYSNRLTGELPRKLGENSPLNLIDVSNNLLTGVLPPNLCNKRELSELLLLNNSFSGKIPPSLSECRSLTRIRLQNNNLSGEVPANLWGLPQMTLLELSHNSFSGRVSKLIASATNLSQLLISTNVFSGEIPEEVGFLGRIASFIANDNHFYGQLPDTIVRLKELRVLDLHNNQFSGELPSGVKNLKKLNNLNLANNQFNGLIPTEIGDLPLNYLDLSNNQFSGRIPNELENLKLNRFNLSNNRLWGGIPAFFSKEIYKSLFLGNPGLCDNKVENKMNVHLWLFKAIIVLAVIMFLLGIFWFYWKYKNFKQQKQEVDRSEGWIFISFHNLGFSEFEVLDCLNEDNVIGTGGSGKVYKVVLSTGETVAVKKLSGSSNNVKKGVLDDGFEAEVDTLGKIRHKSIVRLWCCCKRKDCKVLIYEYMINGSLGDLLHGPKSVLLDWPTRHRIAIDAAEGISYLHHDCVPPIVHRDVKSNNILLDGDFGAKVADFGVAKVVDGIGEQADLMSVIAGSCGYIAPEYAYTLRVNEKSDIYSFGVVLLELVTGKQPVNSEYGDKDLATWVCTAIDKKGMDHVVDPNLDSCFMEEISKVLNIGLLCTSPLPRDRPSMRTVVKMLLEVSSEKHSKTGIRDERLPLDYSEGASGSGSVA